MQRGYIGKVLPLAMILNEMRDIGDGIYFDAPHENKTTPNNCGTTQKRPPKGCKEYFFNKEGEFFNGEGRPILKSETVFYCHATNDKNAIRKFNNRTLINL